MGFEPWVVQLGTLASNAAVIIAAIVAIRGINAWRAELIGKARFEAARDLARLVNRYLSELKVARSRYAAIVEIAKHELPKSVNPVIDAIELEHEISLQRLEPLRKTLLEMDTSRWDAEYILRQPLAAVDDLRYSFNDLEIAIDHLYNDRMESAQNSTLWPDMPTVESEKLVQTIWSGEKHDVYAIRVTAIADILKRQLSDQAR